MSPDELRDIVLAATRAAYPRKPDAVADQVARWFTRAALPAPAVKPDDTALCAFCRRIEAAIWAVSTSDSKLVVTKEKGEASIGLCADCLVAATAMRTSGVPSKKDIRRCVVAALEREREAEAIAELERVLAMAPSLTTDVRDAVCSTCGSPVSYKLVAGGRARICDGCLERMRAGA